MFDLKVNGITILPDSDGNYTANVASTVTDVTIYGEATSEHAIVSIDGETNNTNSITAIRNLESNGYVYSIVVEAENGAYEGKQLTINKLSGDTDITSITVLVGTTTYTAEEQEDGTYYAKAAAPDGFCNSSDSCSDPEEESGACRHGSRERDQSETDHHDAR